MNGQRSISSLLAGTTLMEVCGCWSSIGFPVLIDFPRGRRPGEVQHKANTVIMPLKVPHILLHWSIRP